MLWKRLLLKECIGMGFTIGMHCKEFYYRNALGKALAIECIENGFTIGT